MHPGFSDFPQRKLDSYCGEPLKPRADPYLCLWVWKRGRMLIPTLVDLCTVTLLSLPSLLSKVHFGVSFLDEESGVQRRKLL